MRTGTVSASRRYDILIGPGLLRQLGKSVSALGKIQTVCLVSDSTVDSLYGNQAEESLRSAGLNVLRFVFPAGEASKSGETYWKLQTFLVDNHLTRTDALVLLCFIPGFQQRGQGVRIPVRQSIPVSLQGTHVGIQLKKEIFPILQHSRRWVWHNNNRSFWG